MGSHNQTADMKTFLVLLLVACVLVQARSRGRKGGKGRDGSQEKPMKKGRHHDKGERVWHVAASQEECGDDNTTFHQSHEKPHDLCTEVNATISVCTTRDTEVLESMKDDAEEDAAELRHDDDEDHDHDVYVPKEDAEWDFKTGTCVFKLSMDDEDEDNEKKKVTRKKPTKAEKKRQQDRSKMRKKLKHKEDKGRSNGAKHRKNKKHGAAQPRTNSQ